MTFFCQCHMMYLFWKAKIHVVSTNVPFHESMLVTSSFKQFCTCFVGMNSWVHFFNSGHSRVAQSYGLAIKHQLGIIKNPAVQFVFLEDAAYNVGLTKQRPMNYGGKV